MSAPLNFRSISRGILVGLLVFFRDKGLGVPSIALFLDLFSVKEAFEGFLYLSRRAGAPLIILDLPSSHRLWKERYFFVNDLILKSSTAQLRPGSPGAGSAQAI